MAFVFLPTDFSDANRFYEAFQRRPPLGIQYLQAVLQRSGIESKLLDGVLEPLSAQDLLRRVTGEFDLVGFYVSSMNRSRVCRTIQYLRRNIDVPIIAGGPGSIHAGALIQAGADAVCTGEGEGALIETLYALREGQSLSGVQGISYQENGEIFRTSDRPLIDDLDSLPFPLRDSKTIYKYCDYFNPMVRTPCITLTASRGCYYRCSFCFSHRFWRGRYRLRSVENVIDEITKAHQDFTARYLLFVDDVFPQKLTWVESFIESWQREGLRIPWMCILNPNSYQKDRYTYFKNLRDAGCNVISFGAQSAIPEILKNVHRRPDEAHQLYEAVRTATRLGIATVVTYIFGLPGESEENAEATIHQMLTLRPYLMDAHVLDVLPESEIAERFPSGSVTALSQRRLEQIRKKAFRRFYLNPRTLMRLLWLVTTRNPNWLLLFPFRPVWAAVKRNKKASVDQSASS